MCVCVCVGGGGRHFCTVYSTESGKAERVGSQETECARDGRYLNVHGFRVLNRTKFV